MLVVKLALVTLATATLLAAGGSDDRAVPSHSDTAVEPAVRHPYAVVVDPRGRVFVSDGAARRIVLVSPRTGRRSVHASGFVEPTGLAATREALYVADFHASLVRRVDAAGSVRTLARLPTVTAVAVSPSGAVYDPSTGRTTLVAGGVDTNRIAVARDVTLFLAGSTLTGGSLRRLEPGGKPTILLDDLHVSDVAVLPDGDLVATTVEPGAVFRVDPRTGARKKLVG